MLVRTVLAIIAGLLLGLPEAANPAQVTVDAAPLRAQQERLNRLVSPAVRPRIDRVVGATRSGLFAPGGDADVQRMVVDQVQRQFAGAGAADIDALVYMVMFQLWQEAEEDLQQMMDEMHRMNQQKQQQREFVEALKERKRQMQDSLRGEHRQAVSGMRAAKVLPEVHAPLQVQRSATRHFGLAYAKAPMQRQGDARAVPAEAIEAVLHQSEADLDMLGGLSEEMSLRLQMLMDRRSKIIQTLSNLLQKVSKTSEAIVSNIK